MVALENYLRRSKKRDALYQALRDSLAEGGRVPSTRSLALETGLSRGTVVSAFEMLKADGFLVSSAGRRASVPGRPRPRKIESVKFGLAARQVSEPPPEKTVSARIDFRPGFSDRSLFPEREWKTAVHRALRGFRADSVAGPAGADSLRTAVASYVMRRRGMQVHPDQVVIVNGSLQAITLLSLLLLDRTKSCVVENPGYSGILRAVEFAGARRVLADVDEDGMIVRDWPASVCFVTPARQFPTGVQLSYERRAALADWARKRKAVLVEDDYDSEFRRGGRILEPLYNLLPSHVVHIGTFSRTLAAGLRIGYAILPESLARPFTVLRSLFEPHAPGFIEQEAAAALMRSGLYERHLRRCSREYARRHQAIQEGTARWLPQARLVRTQTGLHDFAWWKGSARGLALLEERWRAAGVEAGATGRYFFKRYAPSLIFSGAHLSEQRIREGLAIMGRVAKLSARFD